jgi:hypothetical protein
MFLTAENVMTKKSERNKRGCLAFTLEVEQTKNRKVPRGHFMKSPCFLAGREQHMEQNPNKADAMRR